MRLYSPSHLRCLRSFFQHRPKIIPWRPLSPHPLQSSVSLHDMTQHDRTGQSQCFLTALQLCQTWVCHRAFAHTIPSARSCVSPGTCRVKSSLNVTSSRNSFLRLQPPAPVVFSSPHGCLVLFKAISSSRPFIFLFLWFTACLYH